MLNRWDKQPTLRKGLVVSNINMSLLMYTIFVSLFLAVWNVKLHNFIVQLAQSCLQNV